MMSSHDFVDWDDLDLDALLGDYTDDDDFYKPDDSHSTDAEAEILKETKTVTEQKASTSCSLYACPACKKSYRSISGFRGHVLKKHPDLHKTNFRGIFV